MENNILPVESIQERDVDLILLEELSISKVFCQWFTSELQLPVFTSLVNAFKSISDFGLGETDILLSYMSNQKRIFLLIENKLDATFQDRQSERYYDRASQYVLEKSCDMAYTALVAPKIYCDNQDEFENFISYEDISIKFKEFTFIYWKIRIYY